MLLLYTKWPQRSQTLSPTLLGLKSESENQVPQSNLNACTQTHLELKNSEKVRFTDNTKINHWIQQAYHLERRFML